MVNLKVYLTEATSSEEDFLNHFSNIMKYIKKNDQLVYKRLYWKDYFGDPGHPQGGERPVHKQILLHADHKHWSSNEESSICQNLVGKAARPIKLDSDVRQAN